MKDYSKWRAILEAETLEELKQAYRRLVHIYHPDKNGNSTRAKEEFQELNNIHQLAKADLTAKAKEKLRQQEERAVEEPEIKHDGTTLWAEVTSVLDQYPQLDPKEVWAQMQEMQNDKRNYEDITAKLYWRRG
jgi:curved DNA-binding protein CbpA